MKVDLLYHIYYKDQFTHNTLQVTQQASLLHWVTLSNRLN